MKYPTDKDIQLASERIHKCMCANRFHWNDEMEAPTPERIAAEIRSLIAEAVRRGGAIYRLRGNHHNFLRDG